MREFVLTQTVDLLHHLSLQIKNLKQSPSDNDAGEIHDVRVAIRRLRQCLLVFSKLYPDDSWKKIRRKLAGVMQSCGEVRDRDIAIALLTESGVPTGSKLVLSLQKERRAADYDLRRELARWHRHRLAKKFQSHLEA